MSKYKDVIDILKFARSLDVTSVHQLEAFLSFLETGEGCKIIDMVGSDIPSTDPTYKEVYTPIRSLMAGERKRKYNGKFLLQYGDDKTIFLTRRGESLRFHIDKILKKR